VVIDADLHAAARIWIDRCLEPAIDEALRAIHRAIEVEVRRQRPLCLASGNCCRFEAFGHRLMVTGLEAAWTLRQPGVVPPTAAAIAAAQQEGCCPFLAEGRLCGIHTARPMACRTFFCDRAASPWQEAMHERCLAEIKRLHERTSLPYRYLEWRTALETCRQAV